MFYEFAADATAFIHLAFVAFVIFGAVLGRRSRVWRLVHLLALAYGVLVEVFSWECPLTILEQYLRTRTGKGIYREAFLAHYLNQVVYLNLPQWSFIVAAALILAFNLALYVYWARRDACFDS